VPGGDRHHRGGRRDPRDRRGGRTLKTIADLLEEIPLLADLSVDQRATVGGCGQNVVFGDGEALFREGDDADTFFALRQGNVALEIASPVRGPLVVQTVHEGDVIGWSWLFEPYRTRFDARARGEVHALAFDGECLRGKCEADHELGYELMRRFASVLTDRLQATRMQLLDLYGAPAAGG
jgi:CRP-like cAMP-binding protein